ncbi:MAG: T9SS type A sorting domain-containing protein [Paludibacteraceae bacterium]|nr:T9SS type A sorting domain-containing protein [Paludibacteraceae bacterium]
MKRISLLFLLCASCLVMQAYMPLVKLGHARTEYGAGHDTQRYFYFTTKEVFSGDTVVEGNHYCHYGDYLLREDVENQKVYVFVPDSSKEYLLYDFDVEVGDSVTTYQSFLDYYDFDSFVAGTCKPAPIVITAIDTIEDLAGNRVRRFWYDRVNEPSYDKPYTKTYVEGYGAIERNLIHYNGPSAIPGEACFVLRCWLDENDNKLMFNEDGSTCLGDECEGSGTVGVDNVEQNSVAIVYADGMMRFSYEVCNVSIVSADGRVVYSNNDEMVSCVNIKLMAGVYVIKYSVGGQEYVNRVVAL